MKVSKLLLHFNLILIYIFIHCIFVAFTFFMQYIFIHLGGVLFIFLFRCVIFGSCLITCFTKPRFIFFIFLIFWCFLLQCSYSTALLKISEILCTAMSICSCEISSCSLIALSDVNVFLIISLSKFATKSDLR